ncbi:hypothetical protein Emtol_0467 [Emticicia oligotrophica DSM 17448]|uniref:Lipoprotein n=1 Tax=Emticicia oligotrophica (strain DSM 17448 / CIP 109782 / MTCC 6937 / GPTSA100-15) TaxID=929562 RepID=A0ABN4ADL6_EMTOG|nr:hypothetical protein [Emticicia oligotrophica]AFK01621.1 hypothetical protein Emtol_0467 [Emticicia oligotrophica DSM 17448]
MKNQSKLRFLTLAGIFALISLSLSSCFYSGYSYYRPRYYSRPYYSYRSYPPPPPRRYYYDNHRNYRYDNRNRGYRNDRDSRGHGRRY